MYISMLIFFPLFCFYFIAYNETLSLDPFSPYISLGVHHKMCVAKCTHLLRFNKFQFEIPHIIYMNTRIHHNTYAYAALGI